MEASSFTRRKAFISYSHKDRKFLADLQIHLKYYERIGVVEYWDDTKLRPGTAWFEEIEKALESAKVAILLVSAYFLASDFIAKYELPKLLTIAQTEGALILPVILRHCVFEDTALAPFQAVNPPSKPLSSLRKDKQDEIWVQLAKYVREALTKEEIRETQPQVPFLPVDARGEEIESLLRQLEDLLKRPLPESESKYQVPFLAPTLPGYDLVGRTQLLHELKQQLLTGRALTLSALRGLPGIGKTALAVALAHDPQVRQHFSDGVLWAGLGRNADIPTHLGNWGKALGISSAEMEKLTDVKKRQQQVQAAIGQKKMLLVADDVWKVEDALALNLGGSNCAFLITTRLPTVAGRLTTDDGIKLVKELSVADGLALLAKLAPAAVQNYPGDALRLIEAVGGLPLAITIVGNFLRVQAQGDQSQYIYKALALLHDVPKRLQLEPEEGLASTAGLPTAIPRSLQAVIGISDEALEEPARQALRALSIFPPKPNTFSEEAALAAAAASEAVLSSLTDAGLLEISGSKHMSESKRYALHQSISDFARASFTETDVYHRLVRYYVNYVAIHTTDFDALTEESSNILTALQIAFERQMHASLVRGSIAFTPFLETRGMLSIAEQYLKWAKDAAQVLGHKANLVAVLLNLGRIAHRRRDFEQATIYLQAGLALAQQESLPQSIAEARRELGIVARGQNQPDNAQRFYEQALEISKQIDDSNGIARTLLELGNVARDRGKPDDAYEHYMDAQVFFRQLKDERNIAETVGGLGKVLQDTGQPGPAQKLYTAAGEVFHRLGDQRSEARILRNQGNLARERGLFPEARRLYERVLEISREVGDQSGVARTIRNLGVLAREQGELEKARRLYQEALDISRHLDDQGGTARTLRNIGVLDREQGHPEQAKGSLEEALQIFGRLEDSGGIARTLRELGIVAKEQGELKKARDFYTQALETFRKLGDGDGITRTLRELGIIERETGQLTSASQFLNDALALSHKLDDQRNLATILREVGSVARDQGDMEEARSHYERASDIFKQLGDLRNLADTERELGILLHEQGQAEQAHQLYQKALLVLRQLGDESGVARALRNLGSMARDNGQIEDAYRFYQEALEISSRLSDQSRIARTLRNLGTLASEQGRFEEAHRLYLDALEDFRQLGDQGGIARTCRNLGTMAYRQSQLAEAQHSFQEALVIFRQLGDRRHIAQTLFDCSTLEIDQEHFSAALPLLLSAGVGFSLVGSPDVHLVIKTLGNVHVHLDRNSFKAVVESTASSLSEPAYRLEQPSWAGAIRALVVQASIDNVSGI